MPDNKTDIEVNTKADVTELKEVLKALGELAEAGSKASEKNAASTKELTDAKREQGGALKGFAGDAIEAAKLGEEAYKNPLTGGIKILAKITDEALGQIHELGERTTPEYARLTDAVKAQGEAIKQADLAAKSFDRSIAAAADTDTEGAERRLGPEREAAKAARSKAFLKSAATPRDEAALAAEEKKLEELEAEKEKFTGIHLFRSEILDHQLRKQNEIEIKAAQQRIQSLKKLIRQDHTAEEDAQDKANAAAEAVQRDQELLLQSRASGRRGAGPGGSAGALALGEAGKVDANQTQLLNMLVSLLNNVQTNQAQTIRAVAEANKNAEAQQTLIEDVKKSIANLALRIGQPDNTNHH